MRSLGVIPVRMGSSRFPGKPLVPIHGIPMMDWVVGAAIDAGLDEVVIATCDPEIVEHCKRRGFRTVMTSAEHQRASDRTAEAADVVEQHGGRQFDVVVMIQGDEPMVSSSMIRRANRALDGGITEVANLAGPILSQSEFEDPNCVKVVASEDGRALLFSRSPVPWGALQQGRAYRQVCVIPFRRDALREFIRLPPSSLEIAESIDMMRLIEHGRIVRIVRIEEVTYPVDTPDDLRRVEELLPPRC